MDFAVLIPAYRPPPALVDLVRTLAHRPIPAILVVDDGSGPDSAALFQELEALPNVTVLRHAVHLGKGAALQTAINYVLCNLPELPGVVAADSDGSHRAGDIERVAAGLLEHPDSLVLGVREFPRGVPLRSRLLQAACRSRIADLETGLRAIPRALFAPLLAIEARGAEFDFEMLRAAPRHGISLAASPIGTACTGGFNPLTASLKIPFVLLRFALLSLLTALLDNLVFYFVWKRTGHILEAQFAARALSAAFNYPMVRAKVFLSRESHQALLPKYLLVVVSIGAAAHLGIQFLAGQFHVAVLPAKLFVESLLFLVNFTVQRTLVFRGREKTVAPSRWFPRLIAAALAALVALELYGFRTANLFHQEIWFAEGLARANQFAGLYAAFGAAILILVPWLFAPLVAASLAALSAIFLGPQAFFAVVFFLLSAWCLGRILARGGLSDSLHLLLGAALYIFLMPFVARLPLNYPLVYAAVLALPIAFEARSLPGHLPRLWRAPAAIQLRSWGERAAFAALVFLLAAHWFAVLKPEASADGLSMHLAIPANIAANHMLTYQPARLVWAVMPMGADFTYTIVYLLGGECAARLLNFVMLLVLLVLLDSVIRRWVPRAVAYLLLALFVSTPMVQLVTGELFVENLLAALLVACVAAIWKFGESGDRRFLYAAAALGGSAVATKIGALVVILMALPAVFFELRRHRNTPRRALLAAAALLLLTAAPPYAIAWAKTGNPLFPFANDRFHSRMLPAGADLGDERFRQPLTWATLYDLTFRTQRYCEGLHGSFGFQYLLMAPLALVGLLVAHRRQAVGATVIALGAAVLILRSEPNARYLYPALALLYIPFASLLAWAAAHRRLLFGALLSASAACLVLNICFLPSSSYYHKDFYGPFTASQREAYLNVTAPIRVAIEWLNRTHPRATVLLAQDSYLAGLTGDVYENHWHEWNVRDRIRQADGMAGLRRLLDEWKVQFLIARPNTASEHTRPASLRELLDHCTVPEFAVEGFWVARLEPGCTAPAVPAAPVLPVLSVGSGIYDDFDPAIVFRGDWERSDQFEDAAKHTVSYTDEPGAEAAFAFKGAELVWVFTRASNRGIAAVTIDGADQGPVDLYSPDVQWRSRLHFGGLGAGRHVVVIRVTGQKRSAAKGCFVDVDSFEVR